MEPSDKPDMNRKIGNRIMAACTLAAACVLALAAAPGCWAHNAGGPVLVSFVDQQTGQPLLSGQVYGLYATGKLSTDGYTVEAHLEQIDAALYQGDALLGPDLPKHLAAGYMYGPGVAWAERWVLAVPGYEAPDPVEWYYLNDKEPVEHIVLLRRLSDESIPFKSIDRFIAAGAAAAELFERPVPIDGIDDTTRRHIASILLDHYRTWRQRWGDPAARTRYYERQAEAKDYDPLNRRHLVDNIEAMRQELEPTVRDAEVLAGRIEKLMAASGTTGSKP